MRASCVKNGLVVGVILLFVGVAIQPGLANVQPSLSTVQPESIDVEYYDVTTEFIGLGKKYTVQLTRQQMDKVEELFESIKLQLDNVDTEEETVRIYNEAIVELDSYGLFGDCSVKQVQKLVTGNFLKTRTNGLKGRLYDKNQILSGNLFCLISGKTTNTHFIPLSTMMLYRLFSLIENFLFNGIILLPLVYISLGVSVISGIFPFSLGNGITLGYFSTWSYRHYPADGWIHIGNIKWEDDIYGQMSEIQLFLSQNDYYLGVTGFTGIKIEDTRSSSYNEYFYVGFATSADVGYSPPS